MCHPGKYVGVRQSGLTAQLAAQCYCGQRLPEQQIFAKVPRSLPVNLCHVLPPLGKLQRSRVHGNEVQCSMRVRLYNDTIPANLVLCRSAARILGRLLACQQQAPALTPVIGSPLNQTLTRPSTALNSPLSVCLACVGLVVAMEAAEMAHPAAQTHSNTNELVVPVCKT